MIRIVKMTLRIFLGIVALPVILVLAALQWLGTIVTGISRLLFRLIGLLFWVTGISVWALGIDTAGIMVSFLIYGVIFMAIPDLAIQLVKLVALAKTAIRLAVYGI